MGACNATKRVVDLAQLQPEGFVIKSDGNDLFIVGRDTTDGGLEVAGTHYGVSEFLERFVGVRWLMPGPLGEVVPKQPTLRIDFGGYPPGAGALAAQDARGAHGRSSRADP